jgi:acyl carrier protein phosphodiesterase
MAQHWLTCYDHLLCHFYCKLLPAQPLQFFVALYPMYRATLKVASHVVTVLLRISRRIMVAKKYEVKTGHWINVGFVASV